MQIPQPDRTFVSSADHRAIRRGRRRRRALRRRVAAAFIIGAAAVVAFVLLLDSSERSRPPSAAVAGPQVAVPRPRGGASIDVRAWSAASGPLRLVERRIGTLPAPLEDPGAAAVGSRVVLAGGLTAQDTSTGNVIALLGGSAPIGRSAPCRTTRRPGRHARRGRSTSSVAATGSASWTTSCVSTRTRAV